MKTYRTAEVAKIIGIHPNTVRLYEKWGLLPKVEREANGYRVFTDFHLSQIRLARVAFQIEVLQNGLRKRVVQIVKESAQGHFDRSIELTNDYLVQLRRERKQSEDAIQVVKELLAGSAAANTRTFKRKEVSEQLHISMDSLRNWEMNGLLAVKRKENGYRVYSEEDIKRLKVIRTLRCANYSLEAILRMLQELSLNPEADIKEVLNTPRPDTDIIAVCDKLIESLDAAEGNALRMQEMLKKMRERFR